MWLVLQDPHFLLKKLLNAVLGDEDVANRDPELAGSLAPESPSIAVMWNASQLAGFVRPLMRSFR